MISFEEVDNSSFIKSDDYKEFQLSMGYRPKMERDLDPRVAFDIGWDYYCHKMQVPGFMSGYKDIADGFNAAKSKRIRQTEHDEYIRKWLQLRVNAWRRNRLFHKSVTPEFIRFIEVDECPVTGVKLTRNQGLDSDWSIDRVNNSGAYCEGNVIIVSARANRLKSNYTFDEILHFAYGEDNIHPEKIDGVEPLTKVEWMRWALISSLAPWGDQLEDDFIPRCPIILPCVITPPNGLLENASACLQVILARFIVLDDPFYHRVMKLLPKEVRAEFNRFVKNARKKRFFGVRSAPNIWHDTSLFNAFTKIYDKMSSDQFDKILKLVILNSDGMSISDDIDLGIETGGYVKAEANKLS